MKGVLFMGYGAGSGVIEDIAATKKYLTTGDLWSTFEVDENDVKITTENIVATTLERGELLSEFTFTNSKGKKISGAYIKLTHPEGSLLSSIAVVEKTGEKSADFINMIPYIEGIENSGIISGINVWENELEGQITIDIDNGESELSYYVSNFGEVRDRLKIGNRIRYKLYAISLDMRKADTEPIKIEEGQFYEMALRDFLEDHPDKTAKDFPYAELHTKGMTLLLPREYSSVYEFRSPVNAVNSYAFMGATQPCFTLDVNTCGDEEIVKMRVLGNTTSYGKDIPTPNTGEDVEGVAWLAAEVIL